jgi:hypothetical protein
MKCAMCPSNILHFNTIVYPIFFAQKCEHVLFIAKLKGIPFHTDVLISGSNK